MFRRHRFLRAAALGCLMLMGCASGGGDGDDTSTPTGTTTPIPSPEPHPLPSDTSDEANPREPKPVATHDELRRDMRRLWTDHVAYTRFYLIESIAGLPGAAKTAERLLQNQTDIGNALKPFYGEAAGNELTRLLKEHIMGAVAVVDAAKGGDGVALARASVAWYANADAIAKFLSDASPSLSYEAARADMRAHLDQTSAEAISRLDGDFTTDVRTFDEVVTHILHFADDLTTAVTKQFPRLVTDSRALADEELRIAERKLWEDHVLWTRVFIIDAVAGTPDLDAATARLLANQDEIGASIADVYGVAAANQLTALLHAHITGAAEVVNAAKAGDESAFNDAKARWYENADAISDFLASLSSQFRGLKQTMREHLDETLSEASHQLSGDYGASIADYDMVVLHILSMSDAFSDGVAQGELIVQ